MKTAVLDLRSQARKQFSIWACLMIGIPFLVLGQAETVPGDLSLEEATQLFIRYNPNLVQSLASATRQSELAQSSVRWPNPSIEFEQERTGAEKQQTGLIDQSILNPVEYRSRKKSVDTQKKAFKATYKEEVATLYFDLRKKYVTAVSSRERLAVLDQLTQTVRRAIEIIRVRYEEGDARSFELKRLKAALADYENRLAERRIERNNAYAELISFVAPDDQSTETFSTVKLSDSLAYQPMNYSLDLLFQQAYRQRGILNAAQFSSRASRQQLHAEKAGRFPDLSIRGGFVREPALSSPNAPFFGAGISIPLWNNNGHQINAFRAEVKQSRARIEIARRQVRLDVQNAYNQFSSYKDRVERINQTLLEKDTGLVNDALYLYSEGAITLVELLDAVSASLDSRLLQINLLTQYQISRYQVERATGEVPQALISSN